MTFTASDLESVIEEKFDEYSPWDEFDYMSDNDRTLTVNGQEYELEVVEADLGGEGHGEYVFVVLKVDGRLFRKEGYYASHYGTDWDGRFEEVEPYKVEVTKYKRKA